MGSNCFVTTGCPMFILLVWLIVAAVSFSSLLSWNTLHMSVHSSICVHCGDSSSYLPLLSPSISRMILIKNMVIIPSTKIFDQKSFQSKKDCLVHVSLTIYHIIFCCNKTKYFFKGLGLERWVMRDGLGCSLEKKVWHLALPPGQRVNCFDQCNLATGTFLWVENIVLFYHRNQYKFCNDCSRHLDLMAKTYSSQEISCDKFPTCSFHWYWWRVTLSIFAINSAWFG